MNDYNFVNMIEALPKYIQEILERGKQLDNFPERSGMYEAALMIVQTELESVIHISQEAQQLRSAHEDKSDPFGVLDLLDEATKIR